MAKTAEDALFSNYVQISLSVVGAGLLFWTLYYSRRATGAAIVAADAAKESADVAARQASLTEGAAERQWRAYIAVEAGGVFHWEEHLLPHLRITVRNVGATPAYSVNVSAMIGVVPAPPSSEIPKDFEELMSGDITIAPNAQQILGMHPQTPPTWDDLVDVRKSRKWVLIAGIVKYIDAFDKQRETRFCHLYQGDDLSKGYVRYHHLGNSAT